MNNQKYNKSNKTVNKMSILDTAEIECNYLILHTCYTSRLIKKFQDPIKRVFDQVDITTVLCIKDQLWGNKTNNAWASWAPQKESAKIKLMLKSLDLDGVIVFKLDGSKGENKGSPFFACNCFMEVYGSGTENSYCGFFERMPYKVSVFEHAGLGSVAYMVFDTESG